MVPVVAILGPTAVGKTQTSVLVAKQLNSEIISCDSMQIYKGMDIGTAKITSDEMQGVPHHLIDIVEPHENFNVCTFVQMAKEKAEDIYKKGRIPILAGGTGLYADSLLNGTEFCPAQTDEVYRQELKALCEEKGAEYIHKMLEAVDSKSAATIHPNNVKRVIRALEYHHLTGNTISSHNEKSKAMASPFKPLRIALIRDREVLYDRINKRVDIMMEKGLVDEVKSLLSRNVPRDSTAMQALGYKEIADYLEGKLTLDEAVYLIKLNSRHYAKRQITWFKRNPDTVWINLDEYSTPEDVCNVCTEHIKNAFKGA